MLVTQGWRGACADEAYECARTGTGDLAEHRRAGTLMLLCRPICRREMESGNHTHTEDDGGMFTTMNGHRITPLNFCFYALHVSKYLFFLLFRKKAVEDLFVSQGIYLGMMSSGVKGIHS